LIFTEFACFYGFAGAFLFFARTWLIPAEMAGCYYGRLRVSYTFIFNAWGNAIKYRYGV